MGLMEIQVPTGAANLQFHTKVDPKSVYVEARVDPKSVYVDKGEKRKKKPLYFRLERFT